jgi:MFS transporter, putative metabolite:H+ symporter
VWFVVAKQESEGNAMDMFAGYERARLKPGYWLMIAVLMLNSVVELFDFYLVGFLVSAVGPEWKLTFLEVSIILVSAGLGQVCTALPLARAADRFGRKPVLLACVVLYSLAAGAIALVPERGWLEFAALRFLVGVGFAGAVVSQVTLIVEGSPVRWRTVIANASGALGSLGVLIAAQVSHTLLETLGWRGVAALGALPALFAFLIAATAPESHRWLLTRGKTEAARRALMRLSEVENGPLTPPPPRPRAKLSELYAVPGRFWLVIAMAGALGIAAFSVQPWAPTILAMTLGVTPAQAAGLYFWVTLAGLVGRATFTFLPAFIGRWKATLISLWGAAFALAAIAMTHEAFIGALPVILLLLIVGALFWDGGFTNIAPYCVELFPVRLAAQGGGLGNMVTGVAKLAGPAMLALIAGTSNVVTPQATKAAVTPAFLTLAAFAALGGIAVLFLRHETHGQPIAIETGETAKAEGMLAEQA